MSTLSPFLKDDLSNCRLKCEKGFIEPYQLGWLKETNKDIPLTEMRQRFKEDGYLMVKGLLDRSEILNLRKSFFNFMKPVNLCVEGKEEAGIFSFVKEPDQFVILPPDCPSDCRPENLSVYHKLLEQVPNLPEYEELVNSQTLRGFIQKFAGWNDIVLLKRNLVRTIPPGIPGGGTHYDYIFLRANDDSFITAWIPLGDISLKGGGLIYLEDSISIAKEMEQKWQESAKELSEEERISAYNAAMTDGARCTADCAEFSVETNRRWLVGNYEAGDVVLHDSFMIHATSTNEDPDDIIRLSTDVRFCNPEKPVDSRWRHHWYVGDGL